MDLQKDMGDNEGAADYADTFSNLSNQFGVDAFTALTNVSAGIINGLEPLSDAIGAGIEEFQNLDSATQKSVGELLGIAKAIDTFLPLLGGLAGGLQSVGTGLTALAGAQGFKALLERTGARAPKGFTYYDRGSFRARPRGGSVEVRNFATYQKN